MPTDHIAIAVKKTLTGIDETTIFNQMKKHYKLLHLIDDNNQWTSPLLQKLQNELLPNDISETDVIHFIDRMSKIAEENQYLTHFLKKTKGKKFDTLYRKYIEEGKKVIPDVVTLSMVLEKLTKAMYHDPEIMELCHCILSKSRKEKKAFRQLPLFHKIKLLSIVPVIKGYIADHRDISTGKCKRNIDDGLGPLALQLNILEATASDLLIKNNDNAKTGWILAMNKAGGKPDPATGAGPTVWSDDKKAVCLCMPLPKKWADLYQTWNMAFVSKMSDYPYILPKLLIPQVADYKNNPTKYLYNRSIALYLYLNYSCFDYLEKKKKNIPVINWRDETLTKIWSECNRISSNHFKEELAAIKSARKTRVQQVHPLR